MDNASQFGASHGTAAAPVLPAAWVTDSVRRLEPLLMAALAAAIASTAVFAGEGPSGLAAAALAPMLAAAWAKVWPARHQAGVAARSTLMVTAILLAALCASAGGTLLPTIWLGFAGLAYGVLLRGAWTTGLTVFAVAGWAGVELLAGRPLLEGLQGLALLVLAPQIAAVAGGAWLRRLDARREATRFDGVTGLFSRDGLCAAVDLLGSAGRPAAVAVFDCNDLLEIQRIYGTRIGRGMVSRVVRQLGLLAGERGFAARTGPAEFTVVLPGAGRERVLAAVQQAFGTPTRVEYDFRDSEIMVVPNVLIGIAGEGEDVGALQAALSRRLQWDRAYEERRLDYLRRERERHSRPAELAPHRSRPADDEDLPVLTAAV
ncbi:GGDEF domain-containing protein [Ramlibacter humi]|nr:GGDEF domain-containing protein [Ramlibacter humi]